MIFVCDKENLDEMTRLTVEWTHKAARSECGWICSDCCCTFAEGMPDECIHGHQNCTNIIKRDKEIANA